MSWILRALVSSAVSVPLLAAEPAFPAGPEPAAVRPCERPEARPFDFRVGDWEVGAADGRVTGSRGVVDRDPAGESAGGGT